MRIEPGRPACYGRFVRKWVGGISVQVGVDARSLLTARAKWAAACGVLPRLRKAE